METYDNTRTPCVDCGYKDYCGDLGLACQAFYHYATSNAVMGKAKPKPWNKIPNLYYFNLTFKE